MFFLALWRITPVFLLLGGFDVRAMIPPIPVFRQEADEREQRIVESAETRKTCELQFSCYVPPDPVLNRSGRRSRERNFLKHNLKPNRPMGLERK